jgi:hypothetical protein
LDTDHDRIRIALEEQNHRSVLDPNRTFDLPPQLGGDVKNIRRRLDPPNSDYPTLSTTVVSIIATTSAAIALNGKVSFVWVAMLMATVGASIVAAVTSFVRTTAAKKDPDLLQAQRDADTLVLWQEEARVKVDRELRAIIARDARASVRPLDASEAEPVDDRSAGTSRPEGTTR